MDSELDRLNNDTLQALAFNEFAPRTTRKYAIELLLDRHLGHPDEPPELAARRRQALEDLKLELVTGRKVQVFDDPHAPPPAPPVVQPKDYWRPDKWEEVEASPAVQLLQVEEVLRAKQVMPELLWRYSATDITALTETQVWHWAATQGFFREHEVTRALQLAREGASLGGRVKKESA